jgi:RHS repeat-associated protein
MANNVYADFSSTGSLETRYLTGPALDQVFGQVAANATTTWNLTDSQGSVRQVVDTSGNVLDTIDYDAYGNITSETGTGSRFKYDGMAWDAALGLYLDHARAYDPADGVFISQDPLSFSAGQSNLSEYVGNAPTDGTDTSGMYESDVHFYMTYYLAAAQGLQQASTPFQFDESGGSPFNNAPPHNASTAYVIAWASQYTDVHPATSPMHVIGGQDIRERFHFRPSTQVVTRIPYSAQRITVPGSPEARGPLNDGIAINCPVLIGIGIHAFEDSWSHAGFGSAVGHLLPGHSPDEPYNDVAKAMEMAQAVYGALGSVQGANQSNSWDQIAPTLQGLFATTGSEADRAAAWQAAISRDFGMDVGFNSGAETKGWVGPFLNAANRVQAPQ